MHTRRLWEPARNRLAFMRAAAGAARIASSRGRLQNAGMDVSIRQAEEEPAQADVAALHTLLRRQHGLADEDAARLSGSCEWRRYPEAAAVVREGEPADALYFLIEGRASIHRRTEGEGRLPILERPAGEVIGEISFLLDDRQACYSATVLAHDRAICACLPFATLRTAALQSARLQLYRSFARTAAERLSSTTGLTAEMMSLALARQRRLAFHLGMTLTVMAGFVVLSNLSVDLAREAALWRLDQAQFRSLFYSLFDSFLGVLYVFLVRALDAPPETLGLQTTDWRRQVASGLAWSVPALIVACALRAFAYPDEAPLSLYALHDGAPAWSATTLPLLAAYVLVLCPVQEFIARAGIQAPIANAFGERRARLGAVVSAAVAAVSFGAMHIVYGVATVLLTTLIGLYWGVVFSFTRSVLAVSVSHAVLGAAAFYWFGLIR